MTAIQQTSILILVLLTPDLSPGFRNLLAWSLIAFQAVCFIGQLKD